MKELPPGLLKEDVVEAYESDGPIGFCVNCSMTADDVDRHGECLQCIYCGQNDVSGAEALYNELE
jgi:hypothetical protein